MFASVSHEFRTPLNAIMSSYKFIGDIFESLVKEYPKKCKKYRSVVNSFTYFQKFLKTGKNSSILLLSLIEDILDFSKMEAGTFKINYSEFQVADLIEEVSDILRSNESKRESSSMLARLTNLQTFNYILTEAG